MHAELFPSFVDETFEPRLRRGRGKVATGLLVSLYHGAFFLKLGRRVLGCYSCGLALGYARSYVSFCTPRVCVEVGCISHA